MRWSAPLRPVAQGYIISDASARAASGTNAALICLTGGWMETIIEAFFFILVHPNAKHRGKMIWIAMESLLKSPSHCYYSPVGFWRFWRIWRLSINMWRLNAVEQCQWCCHNLQPLHWEMKLSRKLHDTSFWNWRLLPLSSIQPYLYSVR